MRGPLCCDSPCPALLLYVWAGLHSSPYAAAGCHPLQAHLCQEGASQLLLRHQLPNCQMLVPDETACHHCLRSRERGGPQAS